MLLLKQIRAAFKHPQFQTDVLKPMKLENIMDQDVKTLSGGKLQRVAIVLALGKPNVNAYLLDEPSSFLNSEQHIITSKVIKRYLSGIITQLTHQYRFVLHDKKTAFVTEHDFIMATYLADRVIVFESQPLFRQQRLRTLPLASNKSIFLAQTSFPL
ncbi:Fe-S cluster-binding ribosome biosynthesis protein [Tephrocybe rancida]|nr:Fe-S cluster-binding ribosome biosynthesis protein [Tephrocybe rancida]